MRNLLLRVFCLLLSFSILAAADDIHTLVQKITDATVRDYYYRSEDASWDNFNFHKDKTREEGTVGHDNVRDYIQSVLVGYLGDDNVYIDEFAWDDGTDNKGYNVIGCKPGNGSSDDVWIIGAHYDSYDMDRTGSAPGANDNGTGIVGVLEICRIIHDRDSDANILFCLWDAEEPRYSSKSWTSASSFGSSSFSGPAGSRFWVNDHFTTDPVQATGNTLLWSNVKGNINLDMFGYPSYDNVMWLYTGGTGWNSSIDGSGTSYPTASSSDALFDAAKLSLETYGYDDAEPRNYVTVTDKGAMEWSDHISFSRAGIPSLEYAESDWHNDDNYHKWTDYYRPSGGDAFNSDENPQLLFTSMVLRGAAALVADKANVALIDDAPLPVTLSEFFIAQSGMGVSISWKTESETENLGYVLERRSSFRDSWETIANYLENPELLGAGTCSDINNYQYIDAKVKLSQHYEYRLSDIAYDGESHVQASSSVLLEAEKIDAIETFDLLSAYPNPFNPTVNLSFHLRKSVSAEGIIYNSKGQVVETLFTGKQFKSGYQNISWTPKNIASGEYILSLHIQDSDGANETRIQKLILQK